MTNSFLVVTDLGENYRGSVDDFVPLMSVQPSLEEVAKYVTDKFDNGNSVIDTNTDEIIFRTSGTPSKIEPDTGISHLVFRIHQNKMELYTTLLQYNIFEVTLPG